MTTTTASPTPAPAAGPSAATGSARRGLATMFASALSNQTGAAIGAHAFSSLGPAGVVAVRQLVAVLVLVPTVRPPVRRFTRQQVWPIAGLGLAFATMNLGLYSAVDRIGLGLAVTLEFLGPLGVALAGSRRRADLACALLAGGGVYLLVGPGGSTDWVGIGFGLLAAAAWAAYILLNRAVGTRVPGLQGTAAATLVSAAAFLPVAAVLAAQGRLLTGPLVFAVVAGLLSSVVPFALDLTALRTVPARAFGLFQSMHPVLATLMGLLLLGQVPTLPGLVGMVLVVAANAVSVASRGPSGRSRATVGP